MILLADGSGHMYRSADGAISFSKCTRGHDEDESQSPESAAAAGPVSPFNCTDECGSWSVIEVSDKSAVSQDHTAAGGDGPTGLQAGVYTFADRSMWQSTNEGQ